jgi:plastocyanin
VQLRVGGLALLAVVAASSPAIAGETIRVTIDKMTFDPPKISAHVGDTIEWASSDFVVHTATAKNKDWDVAIPAKGMGASRWSIRARSTISAVFIRI